MLMICCQSVWLSPPSSRLSGSQCCLLTLLTSYAAVSVYRYGVCLSVPFASCSSVQRLCCCGPHRQAILINCCRACLQHTRPAFSPYPQQHGSQHSAANASSIVFAATSGGEQRLVVHQIGRCVRCYMDTPEVFSTEMVVQTGVLLT